jgi:hypothetical protein
MLADIREELWNLHLKHLCWREARQGTVLFTAPGVYLPPVVLGGRFPGIARWLFIRRPFDDLLILPILLMPAPRGFGIIESAKLRSPQTCGMDDCGKNHDPGSWQALGDSPRLKNGRLHDSSHRATVGRSWDCCMQRSTCLRIDQPIFRRLPFDVIGRCRSSLEREENCPRVDLVKGKQK